MRCRTNCMRCRSNFVDTPPVCIDLPSETGDSPPESVDALAATAFTLPVRGDCYSVVVHSPTGQRDRRRDQLDLHVETGDARCEGGHLLRVCGHSLSKPTASLW